MGNIISNQNIIKPECLICWETIENQNLCMCIRCNITLHDYCEKKDRGKKNIVSVLIVVDLVLWVYLLNNFIYSSSFLSLK